MKYSPYVCIEQLSNTTMNELFKQAIDKACKERKFLPIGYLTATYSKDELAELLETAMQINAIMRQSRGFVKSK